MALTIDFDINRWTGRDFRDYRVAVGEDVSISLGKMGASEDTGALPTDAIYGIAWIGLRRSDPELSYDDVLDGYTFAEMTEAMTAADPTPAAARKRAAKA